MNPGDDVDIGRPPAVPAAPSPERVDTARHEAASGGPQLAKAGFYVAMARHATGGPVAPRNGECHVVFIVEDDPMMSELVAEVLGREGFATRTAAGRAGINAELNQPPLPDLILLDVTLPDADGFQVLERMRGHPRTAKLPVIMMTGKSEVADVARGLALGADGYVTKPFKVAALVSAVKTVLGLDQA